MRLWRDLCDAIDRRGGAALVTVAKIEGSTPRETGARMIVNADGTFSGTIGGGTLEWQAVAMAQKALADPDWQAGFRSFSLGPDLGQCCGGRVELMIERFATGARDTVAALADREAQGGFSTTGRVTDGGHLDRTVLEGADSSGDRVFRNAAGDIVEHFVQDRRSLMLFGAGHVGRALVLALAPLDFEVAWLDPRPDAFPAHVPANVTTILLDDPQQAVDTAKPDSFLAVMTHSHALDQAIVEAAFGSHDFPYVGLIGSATKRARFLRRLGEAGIPRDRADSLVCPIGETGVQSKAPAAIAASIAVELILRDEALRKAEEPQLRAAGRTI